MANASATDGDGNGDGNTDNNKPGGGELLHNKDTTPAAPIPVNLNTNNKLQQSQTGKKKMIRFSDEALGGA